MKAKNADEFRAELQHVAIKFCRLIEVNQKKDKDGKTKAGNPLRPEVRPDKTTDKKTKQAYAAMKALKERLESRFD